MSDWNDTPPTVAGTYWVRGRASGEEWPTRVYEGSVFELHPSEVQFGHRIPTNAELGELLGLIEEYGLRCKAYGLAIQSLGSDEQFGLRMMRDEMLAKINVILGVRNDAGAS